MFSSSCSRSWAPQVTSRAAGPSSRRRSAPTRSTTRSRCTRRPTSSAPSADCRTPRWSRTPITVRKSVRADTANTLREGDIIELQITDVGKKGDGVGKFHDYLVVVPGTVKGAKIHAKISKISAKTAFAVPTTEACTR